MTYIRAEKAQLDAWETLGNRDWTWDTLWPYHLKSEEFETPTPAQVFSAGASYLNAYHGRDGPVNVAYQYGLQNGSFVCLVNSTWQNLVEGVDWNPDVNGGSLRGFFVWPKTMVRGEDVRDDAARAYYYPVKERANLGMVRGRVDRIVWAEDGGSNEKKVARGVEYTVDGRTSVLYAKKEVILSAGSLRSPAILELSGVGNPEYDSMIFA